MNIVLVDDEPLMLNCLYNAVKEAEPEGEIVSFDNAPEVLEYAKTHEVNVFFLDIKMPEMDGVTLAKKIKIIQPRANVIFSTGFSEYMPEAFLLNVSGYLLKPINTKQVREQLDILRYPVHTKVGNKLRFQCFGNFEAFMGEEPIMFRHAKTRELLAYIVSRRGAMCTNNEISAVLWEDGNHDSYLRDLRKDLISTLKELHCEDVIISKRGMMAIITDKVICDYYQWLNGVVSGINAYHGEFMSQYSWAEFVNASIQQRV